MGTQSQLSLKCCMLHYSVAYTLEMTKKSTLLYPRRNNGATPVVNCLSSLRVVLVSLACVAGVERGRG